MVISWCAEACIKVITFIIPNDIWRVQCEYEWLLSLKSFKEWNELSCKIMWVVFPHWFYNRHQHATFKWELIWGRNLKELLSCNILIYLQCLNKKTLTKMLMSLTKSYTLIKKKDFFFFYISSSQIIDNPLHTLYRILTDNH